MLILTLGMFLRAQVCSNQVAHQQHKTRSLSEQLSSQAQDQTSHHPNPGCQTQGFPYCAILSANGPDLEGGLVSQLHETRLRELLAEEENADAFKAEAFYWTHSNFNGNGSHL